MKLVIVESPTKAKTIGQFLGREYKVVASMGHVRDLPKSKIGIDTENDFLPQYVIPVKAKPVVAELKELAGEAEEIILATDEDREGEAISWHLVQALGLENSKSQAPNSKKGKGKKSSSASDHIPHSTFLPAGTLAEEGHIPTKRIVFHEITRGAIEKAIQDPRTIDMPLVDAQQARRVLDRLVGYELSPFLWRKIRYGLSAGRVQSVALRLVVERERAILAFNPEEYWSIQASFSKSRSDPPFPARLVALAGKPLSKMDITSEAEAKQILLDLDRAAYRVTNVTVKEVQRHPAPPFTTSTLQQEAARKLGFSAKQTMMHAQRLYENGHITYMRTDSVNLAATAIADTRAIIKEQFGQNYLPTEPRGFASRSKGAEEAHEAIRPTNPGIKEAGSGRAEHMLYQLIWMRTLACQMSSARFEQTAVDIEATSVGTFRANGQVPIFDGFLRAYSEGKDEPDPEENTGLLPPLKTNDPLILKEIAPSQHFTEPPPRFTDATLVKVLEEYGIGRPSTYAPTLSTIQDRGYVDKIEKRYKPTEIGMLVNDLLVEHFPEIVDVNFTSHIEEELDGVAEGRIRWTEVCREFYTPFKKHLTEKEAEVEKQVQISETPCPHCGKPMVIKFGRMGKFLACPEPGVKVTLPMPEEQAEIDALTAKTRDEHCPICGKTMTVRRSRFGYFLSCSDYPNCKGIAKIWNKTGFKCPNCLEQFGGEQSRTTGPSTSSGQLYPKDKVGDIVERKSRGRGNRLFYGCNRYPDCTFLTNKKPESEADLTEALSAWKAKPPADEKKKRPAKK